MPVKYQSNRIILNTNLTTLRLCKILQDILLGIETRPRVWISLNNSYFSDLKNFTFFMRDYVIEFKKRIEKKSFISPWLSCFSICSSWASVIIGLGHGLVPHSNMFYCNNPLCQRLCKWMYSRAIILVCQRWFTWMLWMAMILVCHRMISSEHAAIVIQLC